MLTIKSSRDSWGINGYSRQNNFGRYFNSITRNGIRFVGRCLLGNLFLFIRPKAHHPVVVKVGVYHCQMLIWFYHQIGPFSTSASACAIINSFPFGKRKGAVYILVFAYTKGEVDICSIAQGIFYSNIRRILRKIYRCDSCWLIGLSVKGSRACCSLPGGM